MCASSDACDVVDVHIMWSLPQRAQTAAMFICWNCAMTAQLFQLISKLLLPFNCVAPWLRGGNYSSVEPFLSIFETNF
jgi:hypothetical protein